MATAIKKIGRKFLNCSLLKKFYSLDPSPPGDAPRFHGERIVAAAAPLGTAVSIGSMPEIRVIAVGAEVALPSVATTIIASPFCRSEIDALGMRLNICWKSGDPLPRRYPSPPCDAADEAPAPFCPRQFPSPRPWPLPAPGPPGEDSPAAA